MEEYRDIQGYEGLYQVSNEGNVKSLDRTIERMSRCGKIVNITYKGVNLRKNILASGYRQVYLCENGIVTPKSVHRLVWETFVGEIPEGYEIDHIIPISDGGGDELSNLRIVTRKGNMNNQLTIIKYLKPLDKIDKVSGEVVNTFNSVKEAKEAGFNHCDAVARGERKQDKGYIFKYLM